MRLQEIYCLASSAKQQLSIIDIARTETHKIFFNEFFLEYFMSIIKKLEPLHIIFPEDLYFIEWLLIPVKGEFRPPTKEENEYIHQIVKNVKYGLVSILEVCKVVGAEPNDQGFCVKLPPNMTLSQLSCCAKDLDRVC